MTEAALVALFVARVAFFVDVVAPGARVLVDLLPYDGAGESLAMTTCGVMPGGERTFLVQISEEMARRGEPLTVEQRASLGRDSRTDEERGRDSATRAAAHEVCHVVLHASVVCAPPSLGSNMNVRMKEIEAEANECARELMGELP